MLAVRTYKQVGLGAAAITLISVVATAGFVHLATHHLLYHAGYRFAMLLAIGLPIVIAVPVSFLALSIVRKVTLAVDKIENFVKFDPLTGVLTRAYFMEGVRLRFGAGGAFMLVDADHFKKINDNCGHDVGDEALRKIGRALNVTTPRGALVGRVGGEEFGIFLPGAAKSDAAAVAGALCEAVRWDGAVIADNPVGLTISIGLAMIARGASLTEIFKEADEALYQAKAAGRDGYVFGGRAVGDLVAFESAA